MTRGVRQQLRAQRVPRALDAHGRLGAGDHDAPGREDEHHHRRVHGAVHEPGEHRALEGALDVVVAVEAVEVERLVAQVQVDVPDDVLHLDVHDLQVEAGQPPAQHVDDAVARKDARHEVAAPREHHLPRREQQQRAVRVAQADSHRRELLLLERAVRHDAVDQVQVQRRRAAEDHRRADHVVHHRRAHAPRVARHLVVQLDRARARVQRRRAALRAAPAAAHVGELPALPAGAGNGPWDYFQITVARTGAFCRLPHPGRQPRNAAPTSASRARAPRAASPPASARSARSRGRTGASPGSASPCRQAPP